MEKPTFDFVIFGGGGDLAARKLIPALFHRFATGSMGSHDQVILISRGNISQNKFIASLKPIKQHINKELYTGDRWSAFTQHIRYVSMDATVSSDYQSLAKHLNPEEDAVRVFYLATRSDLYCPITEHLDANQLITAKSRIVLEKPIGRDLASAKAINKKVCDHFTEDQIFRIDHYLGKDTVQNLLVLRFGNPLFESQWDHNSIDNIQITIAESIGVEGRASFYESTGALRDMVQNHLIQLLCMIAMEPPYRLNAHAVRDEKLKVLRAMRPMNKKDIQENVVRGQYQSGTVDGNALIAYTEEPGIAPNSTTETFVAMKVEIDNMRWSGVPFYLRTGKRLPERSCEIVVQFKEIAHSIFDTANKSAMANKLVLRLQPDESIKLRLCAKRSGQAMEIRTVDLDLNTDEDQQRIPNAYERLINDVIEDRATLFVRRDELEAAWKWIEPILQHWNSSDAPPDGYPVGSWGPPGAALLLAKDGRLWSD